MPRARLLVADHDTLFRLGLATVCAADPELEVAGAAADLDTALQQARTLAPELVLLGDRLPGAAPAEAVAALKAAAPGARIIVLASSDAARALHAVLRAGAKGCLLRRVTGEALRAALHRALHGEPVLSPELMPALVAAFQDTDAAAPPPIATAAPVPDPMALLSPRELEVLRQIRRGASNKDIARALDIAETTVKIHVQHILRKLRVSSRLQAAAVTRDRPQA